MKLLIALLFIILLSCNNKEDSADPSLKLKSVGTLTTSADKPFDTVVIQKVDGSERNYSLWTYVLTSKDDIAIKKNCDGTTYYNSIWGDKYAPFNETICGSFEYIKNNKKRMYDKAWTFIRTKAAREKAISDSIKMLQDLPTDSRIMYEVINGTHPAKLGSQATKVYYPRYAVSYSGRMLGNVGYIQSYFDTLDSALNYTKTIFKDAIGGVSITVKYD